MILITFADNTPKVPENWIDNPNDKFANYVHSWIGKNAKDYGLSIDDQKLWYNKMGRDRTIEHFFDELKYTNGLDAKNGGTAFFHHLDDDPHLFIDRNRVKDFVHSVKNPREGLTNEEIKDLGFIGDSVYPDSSEDVQKVIGGTLDNIEKNADKYTKTALNKMRWSLNDYKDARNKGKGVLDSVSDAWSLLDGKQKAGYVGAGLAATLIPTVTYLNSKKKNKKKNTLISLLPALGTAAGLAYLGNSFGNDSTQVNWNRAKQGEYLGYKKEK